MLGLSEHFFSLTDRIFGYLDCAPIRSLDPIMKYRFGTFSSSPHQQISDGGGGKGADSDKGGGHEIEWD